MSICFGNSCSRIVAPPGLMEITTTFEIYDTGLPDPVPENAVQHPIQDLPDDVLVFCSAAGIAHRQAE